MEYKRDSQEQFTKYETARIIGARALQITMDAPMLLKLSEDELKKISYDPLRIAERELEEGVLPISIHRPIPKKKKDKLSIVKEERVSDEEILAKEQEVEKEIAEDVTEMGLIEADEETADLEPSAHIDEQ